MTSESPHEHNMEAEPMHHDGEADLGHYGYFYFSLNSVLLFAGWTTDSWPTLLGSCVAVILFAMAQQCIKTLRGWLTILGEERTKRPQGYKSALCDGYHLAQSLLEVLDAFLGFLLMLVFMTMNVCLCVAVLIGIGLGYFLFRWKPVTTNSYAEIDGR